MFPDPKIDVNGQTIPKLFTGPLQEKTFEGDPVPFRFVPSMGKWVRTQQNHAGVDYVLFGDKLIPKENRATITNEETPAQTGRHILDAIRPVVTGAATVAGGTYGGVPGGIALGGATDLAQQGVADLVYPAKPQSLTERIIDLFGGPKVPESVSPFVNAVENVGLSYGGEAIAKHGITPFLTGFRKGLVNPDFLAHPEIGARYSRYAGGAGRSLEDVWAETARQQDVQSNLQAKGKAASLGREMGGFDPGTEMLGKEEIVKRFQGNLEKTYGYLSQQQTDRREFLNNLAQSNKAAPKGIPVAGPIIPRETRGFFTKVIDSGEKAFGEQSPIELPKIVNTADRKKIMDLAHKLTDGNGAISFDAAMDIEKELDKHSRWDLGQAVDDNVQNWRNIQQGFDKDINNSFDTAWRKGGQEAKAAYNDYINLRSKRNDLFIQPGPIRKLLGGAPGEVVATFEKGLRDEAGLNRYIEAGNSMKELRAYRWQQMFENAWDADKNKFNPNLLEQNWSGTTNGPVNQRLFNSAQKESMRSLTSVIKSLNQEAPATSNIVKLAKTGVVLAANAGLLGKFGMQHPFIMGSALAGGEGAIYVSWASLANRTLLDPGKAKALAFGLQQAGKYGATRQAVSPMILGAMKGVEAWYTRPDGQSIKGYIDERGKFNPGEPPENKPQASPTITVNPKAAENFNLDDTIKTLREGFSK